MRRKLWGRNGQHRIYEVFPQPVVAELEAVAGVDGVEARWLVGMGLFDRVLESEQDGVPEWLTDEVLVADVSLDE